MTGAPELCPRCQRVVDEHTVAEMRTCMSDLHDHVLPFEAMPGGELAWQDAELVMAGGVVVKAAVHKSGLGTFPLLVFEFSNTDGALPQIGLILDASHMKTVATLVRSAVDASVLAARRAR